MHIIDWVAMLRRTERKCWCTLIVLVSVCALTVSVATRYSVSPSVQNSTIVQKNTAWTPGLQHLLNNAATWIPPVIYTAIYQDRGTYIQHVQPAPTVPSVLLEKNLYNRPPPSVFLFS